MIRAESRCVLPVDGRLASLLRVQEEMSPLFMETGSEANSPGSLSTEESQSNAGGSEREGEGQRKGKRGSKRQEKNRDAARKSRRKQTERADELHEELQRLERSNSALEKEIASLKKDLHLYTTALERHKPFCCLKASASSTSSATRLLVSPSAERRTGPSPRRAPRQALRSTLAAAPSASTSSTPSLDLQTLNCVESTHPSSSAPAATALASSTGSSAGPFTSSSSINIPYSIAFSAAQAPHSLFSEDPSSLIALRPTNATPVCTGLPSKPVPSGSLTTAAQLQPRQSMVHESFSTLQPGELEAFLMTETPFSASSNEAPPYSHLATENTGLVARGGPTNMPQLCPGDFKENPVNLAPSRSLLPSTLQDPTLQSLPVSPQLNSELQQSYGRHPTPNPASLLSLLTIPSPLNVSQTTSSGFDGPQSQPPASLPQLGDPLRDLSLSELLEVNDWILDMKGKLD
ncbi:hypothetical protein L3Q82_016979 [Scortum barcoo]|uniref:Uncharacterized protein n=1 Tax=Scortum barcoo TaxID=214431 RepID=A0ACB8X8W7_9TELE|nr:hypothetical protein L3Q82_016979 [Scortum barcoo]